MKRNDLEFRNRLLVFLRCCPLEYDNIELIADEYIATHKNDSIRDLDPEFYDSNADDNDMSYSLYMYFLFEKVFDEEVFIIHDLRLYVSSFILDNIDTTYRQCININDVEERLFTCSAIVIYL